MLELWPWFCVRLSQLEQRRPEHTIRLRVGEKCRLGNGLQKGAAMFVR